MKEDTYIVGKNLYRIIYRLYGCETAFSRLVIASDAIEAAVLSGLKDCVINNELVENDISMFIPGKYLD